MGAESKRRPQRREGQLLRDTVNADLKAALKAQDKRRISTLRLINAAIKDRDIEARGAGRDALSELELQGVLQRMIKQRQESLAIYEQAGRNDLAQQEREEIEIIASYLPKQMSDLEAGAAISAILHEINAQSMKDMGRAMAALRERFAGKMDFAKASAKIKELLAGKG